MKLVVFGGLNSAKDLFAMELETFEAARISFTPLAFVDLLFLRGCFVFNRGR